jgi:hypothetical protein
VQTVDANGSVLSASSLARARWGATWERAGEIPIDEAWVAWTGVPDCDACVYGMMRHMVGLVAAGYGDDPEEVVGWFADVSLSQWLVHGAAYRIGRHPQLEGIEGTVCRMRIGDDSPYYVLDVDVGGRAFAIPIDTIEIQRAILQSALVVSDP